ncbi:MAG: hypothetical protein ABI408_11545 [Gemmatimonadaceae bacterium]
MQGEHARHPERRIIAGHERARNARRKKLVVGGVLNDLRRYEYFVDPAQVGKLAITGIEKGSVRSFSLCARISVSVAGPHTSVTTSF